jgi:hypothetical protein
MAVNGGVIVNDPKKQPEPQRVSNPQQEPPMEAPQNPQTEYEKSVPHSTEKTTLSVSQDGKGGEGSYQGTKQYQDGYKKFSKETSPDDAMKKANDINPNDASLKQAEQRGKNGGTGGRISAPSIH